MHQVTVTIEDVERATRDVVKYKHQRYLQLTFRSEDGSRQWWEVPGWPEVRPGMTVTALLSRPIAPNRSNRVLGWKCHETGQLVVGQSPIRSAAGSIVFAIMGALALRLYSVSPDLSSLTSPIPGVAFLSLSVLLLVVMLKGIIIRTKLNALRVSSGVRA